MRPTYIKTLKTRRNHTNIRWIFFVIFWKFQPKNAVFTKTHKEKNHWILCGTRRIDPKHAQHTVTMITRHTLEVFPMRWNTQLCAIHTHKHTYFVSLRIVVSARICDQCTRLSNRSEWITGGDWSSVIRSWSKRLSEVSTTLWRCANSRSVLFFARRECVSAIFFEITCVIWAPRTSLKCIRQTT